MRGARRRVRRWSGFPYGTLFVNVLGCFLIGFLMAVAEQRPGLPPLMRPLLVAGFLGGLTTFSTFSYESVQMLLSGNFGQALANLAANLLLCLAATAAGLALGRYAA